MPLQSNFSELIPEKKKLFNITIKELLNNHLDFKNKTLILFDIETLGFNPKFEYEQIIELSAISISGDTMKQIDKLNYKISLLDSTLEFINDDYCVQRINWKRRQQRRGKTAIQNPTEILELTKYFKISAQEKTEKEALKQFLEFIDNQENPVLVAHNIDFDLHYLRVRSSLYEMKVNDCETFDTLRLSQFFFVPAIESSSEDTANKLRETLSRRNKKRIHVSSRLGDLANAFDIDCYEWHTSMADVEMMFGVMKSIIHFLSENQDIDIENKKRVALKRTLKQSIVSSKKRK